MPIVLDGTQGISTPMYAGSISSNPVTPSVNMKNRIINGSMVIDQRNAGASVTINSAAWTYVVDRFCFLGQSTDGVFTAQQSSTAPAGFNNSLLVTVTTADASIGASQIYTLRQTIEGFNTADLNWGTANAKTITLSFWVRSSLTGTFGGALNNEGTRSYPFTYTISAANTWEYKTVTVAGDTTGTWGTTNSNGIRITWGLGVGTTYSGTAGAWAGSEYFSATGAVSVIGTNGATFYITGVQLEVGSTATSFDYRPFGTELLLCQRYFFKNSIDSGNGTYMIGVVSSSTAVNRCYNRFPATMRSAPTASFSGSPRLWDGSVDPTVTSISNNNSQTWGSGINIEATGGGLSTGRACLVIDGTVASSFSFSAEL